MEKKRDRESRWKNCYFCHLFRTKAPQSLGEEEFRMVVLTKEALIREHTYLGSTLSVLYKNAQPLTSALIREQTFLEEQVCLRCRQGIEDDDRLQYAERTAYTDKLFKESKHPLENSSTVNQAKGCRQKMAQSGDD